MIMGYPDMKCMYITIWVHHMQIDELFDFMTSRIDMPPPFWYNHEECPYTVTGGYTAINLEIGRIQLPKREIISLLLEKS
jgi:hypothetical protein